MVTYKDCTPNELDYQLGKGGKTTITIGDQKYKLTFKDVPAEKAGCTNVQINSDPKQVMESIIIDAYHNDKINDSQTQESVKEKLAECINTAAKNRFGLI
ncbi:hypothetical protein H5S09_08940 [Limosilactobacillus sp. STM2_1]|uniref:Uncharacterized protein n=1 Tax=Limosilactobacillus rudii TaxID=2759755 RepID=A0A7W3UN96_9LACO|nr:hypothetical protein [Limosilactobacillus rudii]MBB1079982.1 hypothetical protein [Limosilactobacillus rudii]MBB1098060.1 hypothetical protein [Limosilactobacillus rudii]MCD7135130.1 hypothetical protein [Limosilactobacillus rudii]